MSERSQLDLAQSFTRGNDLLVYRFDVASALSSKALTASALSSSLRDASLRIALPFRMPLGLTSATPWNWLNTRTLGS